MYVASSMSNFLYCSSILGKSVPVGKAGVTGLAATHKAVWVGTRGGYLLAFNPLTADVLLVHQKSCCFSCLVCLSEHRLVSFGEGVVGGVEAPGGEDGGTEITGMFTVWNNYID